MKKFIVYFIGLTLMAIGWLLLGFPFIAGICFDETSRLETVIKPTVEKIQAGVKQIDQNLQKKYHTKKVDPNMVTIKLTGANPRYVFNEFGVRIYGTTFILPKHIWEKLSGRSKICG